MNGKYVRLAQLRRMAEAIKNLLKQTIVPVGGILVWSGGSDAVPDGWALCDGTNGTPDLRDQTGTSPLCYIMKL